MFNYLLRLGWASGDLEEISRPQAVELFGLDGVGKSPSRFDLKKLENLNGHYIREADDAMLAELTAPIIGEHADLATLTKAMPVLKTRAKNLNELAEGAGWLFAKTPLVLSEKAAKFLDADGKERLALISEHFQAEKDWTFEALEATTKSIAEAHELGFGKLAQPLRAALTGTTNSPGIFDVLVLLGREEALARINAQAAPTD
jgi:glutamyl-tRNA synthetase